MMITQKVMIYIVLCIQDPIRWKPLTDVVDGYSPTLPHLKGLQNGDTATSAIKQVIALTFYIEFSVKFSITYLILAFTLFMSRM